MLHRSDPGKHQEMQRIENPATEVDLTVGMNHSSDTTLLIFEADGFGAFEQDTGRLCFGDQRQVRP